MKILELASAFVCITLPAIVLTTLFCRYRLKHNKPPSFGVVLIGTLSTAFLVTAVLLIRDGGWRLLSLTYWTDWKGGFITPFIIVWAVAAWAVLPAAGTVLYYRRRGKHPSAPVA